MAIPMPKWKQMIFLFTLMFSNIIIMESYILSPTFNVLYELFAGQENFVNFIVSGSYLLVVVASPLATMLCGKIGEKPVLLLGGLFATAGGILLGMVENVVFMCAMRCLYTVGYAMTQISCVATINKFYVDEKQRGYFMGYYNASMTVVGAIFSVLAGNLAAKSIYSAYALHWVFVPYLILALLFVPNLKNTEAVAETEAVQEKGSKSEKMGAVFWLTYGTYFLFCLAFGIVSLFVSVYVAENTLGSEAMVGYMNTANMIAGFFASMAFGFLLQKLGRGLLTLVYIVLAAGLALYWLLPSVVVAYGVFALMGLCYATMNTYAFAVMPTLAPASRTNDAIAMATIGSTLASFVASYLTTWYMGALNDSFSNTLYIPMGIAMAIAVVSIVVNIKSKKTAAA